MRSITTLDLQYAHRFYGFKGEAQYLHGHTGVLTIEVEDTIEPGVNMVFPCNEIQKTAWSVLKNFDHALILREDDPLLPAVLKVYEEQGIRDGAPQNQMKGPAFQTELATAYPECRLVVTKETLTVEGMIKIVYDLLKDKLNIAKITFTSGVNAASAEFTTNNQIDRCPLCGIALNENPEVLVLTHGGPFADPETAQYSITHSGADGYASGSSGERVPTEQAVVAVTQSYKAMTLL